MVGQEVSPIPDGDYDGFVHGWAGFFNWVWSGKRFSAGTVINRICGRWMIRGTVTKAPDGTVTITYPMGLKDTLRQTGLRTWEGTFKPIRFGPTIRFDLTRKGNYRKLLGA